MPVSTSCVGLHLPGGVKKKTSCVGYLVAGLDGCAADLAEWGAFYPSEARMVRSSTERSVQAKGT